MDNNGDFLGYALTAVGPIWLVALAAMIVTGICESARPKPADGEKREGGFLVGLAALATLITPLLLFIHAFWSMAEFSDIEATPDNFVSVVLARRVILIALLALLIGITIVAGIIGWIIRAAAPDICRKLGAFATPLALVTLLITIYATYQVVGRVWTLLT